MLTVSPTAVVSFTICSQAEALSSDLVQCCHGVPFTIRDSVICDSIARTN